VSGLISNLKYIFKSLTAIKKNVDDQTKIFGDYQVTDAVTAGLTTNKRARVLHTKWTLELRVSVREIDFRHPTKSSRQS
jgi:hypothetical protein